MMDPRMFSSFGLENATSDSLVQSAYNIVNSIIPVCKNPYVITDLTMSFSCNACGFDNPPGMRFCGNCGTRLSARPREQVRTTNLGVMMGADLIERFRKAGIQATGQRRNVTVLFVDLSDYTPLSEKTDSEELFEIIQQFINMLVGSVYKYDGMVDKIVGDGLMALFGAPISHENNAELAVLSALEMQAGIAAINQQLESHLQQELRMHIGCKKTSQ